MIPASYVADVTVQEHRPVTFPDVVAELERAGFRMLGRFTTVAGPTSRDRLFAHSERERLSVWRGRPAYAVLAAGDGSAYAAVDSYGDAPVISMRTELADGSLVETVGIEPAGILRPRFGIDPYAAFTGAASRDRSVLLQTGAVPTLVVAAHADHVRRLAAERGSRAVIHDDRDHALHMWARAQRHAERTARRGDLISRWVGCTLIAVIGVLFIVGLPSTESWAMVLVTPLLFLVVALLALSLALPVIARFTARHPPSYRDG